jgi:acetyl esterase/lipase
VTNLHHEIAARSELIPQLDLSLDALPQVRAFAAQAEEMMKPALSDGVERVDHVIATDPHVVVRVHRSKRARDAAACLYYVHGGGYVLGSYTMNDVALDGWCTAFGCVAVSVEYRLAPETPYPGPLDDCYRGLRWVFEHAAELGVDPARIGIGGVSAGGGLAAALALLARDRDDVRVAFQLLECPMLDDRQITPSSCDDDLVVWTRAANTFGWQSYLGELYGGADVPAYAAPGRARDLRGLPPAFVITGGADGFRDEDIEYALRLGQAGVPTDLHVIAGAPHGVQLFAGTEPAQRWSRAVDEWLRPRLTSPPQECAR